MSEIDDILKADKERIAAASSKEAESVAESATADKSDVTEDRPERVEVSIEEKHEIKLPVEEDVDKLVEDVKASVTAEDITTKMVNEEDVVVETPSDIQEKLDQLVEEVNAAVDAQEGADINLDMSEGQLKAAMLTGGFPLIVAQISSALLSARPNCTNCPDQFKKYLDDVKKVTDGIMGINWEA